MKQNIFYPFLLIGTLLGTSSQGVRLDFEDKVIYTDSVKGISLTMRKVLIDFSDKEPKSSISKDELERKIKEYFSRYKTHHATLESLSFLNVGSEEDLSYTKTILNLAHTQIALQGIKDVSFDGTLSSKADPKIEKKFTELFSPLKKTVPSS